jgi:tetratricopeptide (TPR) repeat protein
VGKVEPVKPLEPPDSLHLQAAEGWCELHAFAEADAELDNIAASLRAHPKVLEVRWQVYANLEKWAGALDIASAIVKLVPDWPSGWIYRASSLTELNRHQEAYETLSDAVALFPADEIILYDLACVCCALKRFDEARTWLAKAIETGGNAIKLKALDDSDLEPLWKRIGEL